MENQSLMQNVDLERNAIRRNIVNVSLPVLVRSNLKITMGFGFLLLGWSALISTDQSIYIKDNINILVWNFLYNVLIISELMMRMYQYRKTSWNKRLTLVTKIQIALNLIFTFWFLITFFVVEIPYTFHLYGVGCCLLSLHLTSKSKLTYPILYYHLYPADRGGPAIEDIVINLPTVTYNNEMFGEGTPSCVVCLEEYQEGDVLRQLPCNHHSHKNCLDPWLSMRGTCPLCIQPISTPPSTTEETNNVIDLQA